ncbi:MAG: metalloprotease PmbA [Pseudomonadota bacterium]
MHNAHFPADQNELKQIARDILAQARNLGASAAETDVSTGIGQSVTVRKGNVETIEYNRDKGLSVTVYFGKQRGSASSSDFSPQAIRDTVQAAASIAQFTAPDEFSGLADEALLAKGEVPDLELYHPWDISVEDAIELAKRTEAAAFAVDSRINNSEGANIGTNEGNFVYANTLDFCNGYATSRHGISCTLIAGTDDGMQRDYWYSTGRDVSQLDTPEKVGRIAGERTIARLKARKLSTREVPILFDPSLASGLIGHFVSAVSGGSLYRKSSFLLDSLGKQVFSPIVQIHETPHLKRGLASGPFDGEGVVTTARDLVKDGIVQGYFLGSYSARKLGMQSTGNAGGSHNLILKSGDLDFAGLLKKMDRGFVVTELLGQGVNPVTGDYSRGAAGFWVEGGEIQHAVEEVTIAGNLLDMFRNIVAVGNDVLVRGSKQCGSILIEKMTIAGE